MIKRYPKIFHLGTKYVDSIFDGPVSVEEMLDGSQFAFGKVNDQLQMRSKNKEIHSLDKTNKTFSLAVESVLNMSLPDNMVFYCEYMRQPKHNTLKYNNVPKNNLMLFGVTNPGRDKVVATYSEMQEWAEKLSIDCVPQLFYGETNPDEVIRYLDTESYLGGTKVEGVVVKRVKDHMVGDSIYPVMAAKYVSEDFKEKHKKNWTKENTSKGKWEQFKEDHRTEARWNKAVQTLRDKGELEFDPKDIGNLIKEIHNDIEDEEKENIKDFLWKEFGSELLRTSTKGFPEWYKENLAKNSFS